MAKLIYKRLPTEEELGLGFSIRPQMARRHGRRAADGRVHDAGGPARPEEASTYETQTAGAKGGGRASTPSMVHGSEVAHWEDPDYLTGLFNALPMEPDTIGVLESTANGFNHFFDLWTTRSRARRTRRRGSCGCRCSTAGRTTRSTRCRSSATGARPVRAHDRGPGRRRRRRGDVAGRAVRVTLEQLNWRRATINGPGVPRRLEMFHQEHPATPEQAFIGSGIRCSRDPGVAGDQGGGGGAGARAGAAARRWTWQEKRTRAGTILVPQRAVWVPEQT
jgi:hypothetical protein